MQKQTSNFSCPVQFYWISLVCSKYFAYDCRLIRICRIQWYFLLSLFWARSTFFGKFGPKNRNCQIKIEFGTQTDSNIKNSVVMLIFSVFDWKYPFLGKINFKKSILFVELIFRAQTNQNMQNLMVIFIFFFFSVDQKDPFWVSLVQKLKIVSLSLNLAP